MARTKTTTNPPPPKVNHRALYPWAPDELLDEYSRHHDDIAVLPCTLGEPVCGVPFFYFYQVVFKHIGMRLRFSRFERELLTEINIAPA